MTKEEFDAILRAKIAEGEITPEEAESEWDYFVNGFPSYQNVYGM